MTAKLCLVDHAIEMFPSLLKTPTGSKSRVRRGLDARSACLLRMLDLQFALFPRLSVGGALASFGLSDIKANGTVVYSMSTIDVLRSE